MNATSQAIENGIDTPDDLPHGATRLGVDGKGTKHYFSNGSWTVWVFADDELVHTENLAAGTLGQWVAHIEDTRGWEADTLNYSEGLAFEGLVETLAAGLAGTER